jgi:hypothetical protein
MHPFFVALSRLQLPGTDFAIAGSGPLFARGWIPDIGDLDVIARGTAWKKACKLGEVINAPFSRTRMVPLFNGKIEVLDGWFPEIWSVDKLIDEADHICGLRFVQLDIVFASKEMLQRPRDKMHLNVLTAHGIPRESRRP